jgi:hypothetical protein
MAAKQVRQPPKELPRIFEAWIRLEVDARAELHLA